jgi:predicted PurR-regulated permease PerM
MVNKYPFYLKSTTILFGLILFVYALTNLRQILVPVSFALLLAILLNPIVNRLEKWRVPKIWSIILALLVALIFITGIGYFLSTEITGFSDELPVLKKKFFELSVQFQHEINQRFGINTQKQNQYISEAEAGMKPWLGATLTTVAGSLSLLFLLPVYGFLLLFYKGLILNFLYEIFEDKNSKEVALVLTQTKNAIQSYTLGLLLEALAVAALNSLALLLLGVKYYLLLGVLGALLNIIPFIGGILAVLLPLTIATITKDGFQTQLWVIIAYIIIQFIDNHFLVPYIVSSRVKINALVSILIVLGGAAVWGVPGMFLSIPFIGVLKIIFDRVPGLKPWGKLLGSEMPVGQRRSFYKTKNKKTVL